MRVADQIFEVKKCKLVIYFEQAKLLHQTDSDTLCPARRQC